MNHLTVSVAISYPAYSVCTLPNSVTCLPTQGSKHLHTLGLGNIPASPAMGQARVLGLSHTFLMLTTKWTDRRQQAPTGHAGR